MGQSNPEPTPGLREEFSNDHCRTLLALWVHAVDTGRDPLEAAHAATVRYVPGPYEDELARCLELLESGQADDAIAWERRAQARRTA